MSTQQCRSPIARAAGWFAAAALAFVGSTALADPPARVGRISHVSGEVSFQSSANHEPAAAQLNWPVTNANVLMTGPSGRAEVKIGSTALRIDGDSEVEFAQLDDERVHVRVITGRTAIRVQHRDQADDFIVTTAHGRALLDDVGRYRIDVAGDQSLTAFTTHEGVARFDLPDTSLVVQGGARIEAWGGQGPGGYRSARAYRDNFDEWGWARDRRAESTHAANYVSPDMTGYDDLDEHGQWRHVEEHGPVWVPHAHAVPAGWAPYRWGRWVWIEPWGWTWVDQAPWGFAPFHYGRWVHHGGAWAWAPGLVVRRPVYAPALVGWIGRPGSSVTIATGPAVGWFPLGPREVYYPAHPCTPRYVRNVNVTHVANPGSIVHPAHGRHDPAQRMHYRHADQPHAVTLVPAHVMSRGGPVTPNAVARPDARTLAALPVAAAASTLAPTRPQFAQPEHRPGQFWSPHRRNDRPAAAATVAPQSPSANAPQGSVLPRPDRRDANEPGRADRRVDSPTPRGFPPVPAGPMDATRHAPREVPPVQQPHHPQGPVPQAQQPAPVQAPVVRRDDGPNRPQGSDRVHGNERRDGYDRPRHDAPRHEPPRVESPRMVSPRVEPPRIEPPRVEQRRPEPPRIEQPRHEPPRIERPREMPRVEQQMPRLEQRVERRMDHQPVRPPAPVHVEQRRPAPVPMPAVSAAPPPRVEPPRQHGGNPGQPGPQGNQGQQQRRGPNDQRR